MLCGRTTKTIRATIAATLFGLVAVTSADAQTLVGGGSAMTSVAFVGYNALSPSVFQFYDSLGVGANAISTGSLLGVYMMQSSNPTTSYCQSGDGVGKNILAGGTIAGTVYNVQNNCNIAGAITGFGANAPQIGRPDLAQPNFIVSEAPLTASDLNNYQSAHGVSTWPIQFPALASAIAITFNIKDSSGAQLETSQVNFSDAQLCEIFSGRVTTWADPNLASAFALPAGRVMLPNPIRVIFHSESAGETFGLSNHLSAVCPSVNVPAFGTYFQSHFFQASQNFAGAGGVVSGFFPVSGTSQSLPSGWLQASSDQSMGTAIENTPNSIGYVSSSYAIPQQPNLAVAYVNSASPIINFGTSLMLSASDVVYNSVLGTNTSEGRPTLEAIPTPPTTQCIATVLPQYYAIPSQASHGSPPPLVPVGTYPIVAISYLLGNAQNNKADTYPIQNLMTAPYTPAITENVTTVGPRTGTAFLTLVPGANLNVPKIANCVGI